jgi:DNA-binding NarL/FixJ family response regulator
MRREGALSETVLQPITPAVTQQVVERAVEGEVDPQSLAALVECTAGIPLYLREIVAAAMRSGRVLPGPNGLIIDSESLPFRLRDSLTSQLDELEPTARHLVDLIAVATGLPRSLLDSPAELDLLQRSNIVTRGDHGELRIAQPLLERMVRESLSAIDRQRLRAEAVGMLRARGNDDDRLAAIRISADFPVGSSAAGLPTVVPADTPDARELAWAAGHANGSGQHALAIALAGLSIEQTPGIDALLTRASSLSLLGRSDDAARDFAHARTVASDPGERMRVASSEGTHLATAHQRLDLAVDLANRTLAGSAATGTAAPNSGYLAAHRALWLLMSGTAVEGPSIEPDLDSPDASSALNAAIHATVAAVYAADLPAARAAIARADALLTVVDDVPHAIHALAFAQFLVLAFEGRVDDALRFADESVARLGTMFLGTWDFGRALFQAHRGALDAAGSSAARAQERLSLSDYSGTLGVATALRASIAAQSGDTALADTVLAGIDPHARDFVKEVLLEREAEAMLLAQGGELERAAAVIGEAVTGGLAARYHAYSALTAHYAVRMGRPDAVLDSLRTMAETSSSELIAAILAHAEAAAGDDADALLLAAERLGAAGMIAGAADAARLAGRVAKGSQRGRTITRAAGLVRRWSTGPAERTTPARQAAPTGPTASSPTHPLTQRELTIARAAAELRSSHEIAEQLGLSSRTVDNHLRNVYRKLGVSRRAQLHDALNEAPGGRARAW